MKAHLLNELKRRSGLTEEFALMCLNETGWVFERAWEAFLTVSPIIIFIFILHDKVH